MTGAIAYVILGLAVLVFIGVVGILGIIALVRLFRPAATPIKQVVAELAPYRSPHIVDSYDETSRPNAARIINEELGIEDALAYAYKFRRIGERLETKHGAKPPEAPKS